MSACILFLSVFYFTRSENIIKKLTRRHPTDTHVNTVAHGQIAADAGSDRKEENDSEIVERLS